MIPVATAALSDSACPIRGIVICSVQKGNNSWLTPLDSFPMRIIPSIND